MITCVFHNMFELSVASLLETSVRKVYEGRCRLHTHKPHNPGCAICNLPLARFAVSLGLIRTSRPACTTRCSAVYHFVQYHRPIRLLHLHEVLHRLHCIPVQLKVLSQPVNDPDGASSSKPRKLAVTFLFPSIVTVVGLLVPLASPLQLSNTKPVPGAALNCNHTPSRVLRSTVRRRTSVDRPAARRVHRRSSACNRLRSNRRALKAV